MSLHGKVHLEWVIVQDQIHHVSDFADISPNHRPQAICPVCFNPIILKLGKVKAHHAAHKPDVICETSFPETILHLNAKYHIYNQLRQGNILIIEEPCDPDVFPYCQDTQNHQWEHNWETIEVEYQYDSFRFDIALLQKNVLIAAIEIQVTHEIDDKKRLFLEEQEISCIEVKGDVKLYDVDAGWKIDKPLPILLRFPKNERWLCANCQHELAQIEYRKHNYTDIHCARLVDLYYPNGKQDRIVYTVVEQVKNAERIAVWLNMNQSTISKQEAPITKESMTALKLAYIRDINGLKKQNIICDSPMQWKCGEEGKIVDMGFDHHFFHSNDFPRRYVWSRKGRRWYMPYKNGNIEWNSRW